MWKLNQSYDFLQVHHGGAGTTAAGLKAAVKFYILLAASLYGTC